MSEIEDALIGSGLTRTETEVYIAILTDGPIGAGAIAKRIHRYRANVYQAIERLKLKGFVSETSGKRSYLFEAMQPSGILSDLEKRMTTLEGVIPALNKMKSTSTAATSMRIIEGVNGWRHLLNEFLEIGQERVVYGIPKEVEMLSGFFAEYHKKRVEKKVWLRHLFNYDARERIRQTNKLPYTKSRHLPKELNQPVSTSICGSLIALTAYGGRNITTIVIDNKTIADAYRGYFEYLWKLSSDKL